MKKRRLSIFRTILALLLVTVTVSGCAYPMSITGDETESDTDVVTDLSESLTDSEIIIDTESDTEEETEANTEEETEDATKTETEKDTEKSTEKETEKSTERDTEADAETETESEDASKDDKEEEEVDLSAYAPLRDGKKVTFGSYPQSKVTSSSLISKLNSKAGTPSTKKNTWTVYEYYETEKMWYADVEEGGEKYRGVYFSAYRPTEISKASSADNSLQDNNGYSLNTVYWFKYEPITWTVLKTTGGKSLVFCDMIIDSHSYSASRDNNYAESAIRAWLNGAFAKSAFNDYEREFIVVTKVDNSKTMSDYSGTNPFLCENTNDRVFLLSKKEVKTSEYGFSSDSSRVKKVTEYAKSQGTYASDANENWWWLRTPSYDASQPDKKDLAHNIKVVGSMWSTNVGSTSGGVVPAMWIVFDVEDIQESSSNEGNSGTSSNNLPDYPASTKSYNCYDDTTMYIANDTNLDTFKTYCKVLKGKGYEEYSTRDNVSGNYYRTYTKGSRAVTAYYIANTKTARVISGPTTDIPTKKVDKTPETYKPSVTLLSQGAEKGSGLGLIFRLPNGKFFIYDGGYAQNDALYNKLKSLAGNDKIVIAAWVISHPHQDHQEAFEYLMQKHSKDVTIENLMYNYTKATDEYGSTETIKTVISKYLTSSTNIIKPHTGQIYNFGSSSIEILYTVEDYMPNTISDLNQTSLVVRFTVGGQTVIALGDILEKAANIICNMHGSYLKSDIVQLAHHGTTPGNKAIYTNINAPILLWPSCASNVKKRYKSSGHESLSEAVNKAKDIYLAGDGTVTLNLPLSVVNNKSSFLKRMGF